MERYKKETHVRCIREVAYVCGLGGIDGIYCRASSQRPRDGAAEEPDDECNCIIYKFPLSLYIQLTDLPAIVSYHSSSLLILVHNPPISMSTAPIDPNLDTDVRSQSLLPLQFSHP